MRLVLLDKGILQDQGLEFRIGHDDIEVTDFLNHGFHLGKMISVEIAADSVFQLFCLSHIDHVAVFIQHEIHARKLRQIIRFFT